MSQCLNPWRRQDQDQLWPGERGEEESMCWTPVSGGCSKDDGGRPVGCSGHSPQDIKGHVPLQPCMDPKTLFTIWLNSQKYLESLTYIFSDIQTKTTFLYLEFWADTYIYLLLVMKTIFRNILLGLVTPHQKGWESCLDDAGILITNGFLLINLFNKITTVS